MYTTLPTTQSSNIATRVFRRRNSRAPKHGAASCNTHIRPSIPQSYNAYTPTKHSRNAHPLPYSSTIRATSGDLGMMNNPLPRLLQARIFHRSQRPPSTDQRSSLQVYGQPIGHRQTVAPRTVSAVTAFGAALVVAQKSLLKSHKPYTQRTYYFYKLSSYNPTILHP